MAKVVIQLLHVRATPFRDQKPPKCPLVRIVQDIAVLERLLIMPYVSALESVDAFLCSYVLS
jgi:hypothetical protein